VTPFRELAVKLGAADLAAQLTMLEVLARAKLHDATGARTLTDQIVAPAAQAGALRAPIASFYVGVATWAEGDLRTAAVALRDTWTFLEAHHHEVLAPIVGHYLARVSLALGDVPAAIDLFERTTRRAAEVGMGSLTAVGAVYHARALIVVGDTRTARSLAKQALAEVADGNHGATAYTRHIAHRVLALASALEGDLAAARVHLADALTFSGAEAAHRIDTALDRADVELCGGDAAVVVQAASTARNHYAGRGRRFLEARACVAVAAGHAALGGPGDLAMAEEALARADDLSARYGYEMLHLHTVLVRAAMLGRRGDRSQAERLLTEALASGAARPGGIALLLCSALGSGRDHQLPAGLAAQLVLLGLRRQAAPPEADVVVDPRKVTISSRHTVVKGRPIACALLACLVDGQGQPVPADVLYCTVWGVAEYHALRHRNTLYVALNRLRQTLSELCTDREGDLIETLPAGWRLAEGLVARNAVTGASSPSPS
jgi:DNA-binding winged helix-turn-helix (wHTH) protein